MLNAISWSVLPLRFRGYYSCRLKWSQTNFIIHLTDTLKWVVINFLLWVINYFYSTTRSHGQNVTSLFLLFHSRSLGDLHSLVPLVQNFIAMTRHAHETEQLVLELWKRYAILKSYTLLFFIYFYNFLIIRFLAVYFWRGSR